jgi:pantoate--beta-alanine ligase
MGALHEGHLSLIRKAKQENNLVVVSIFVNPIQFNDNSDFKRYPRNLKNDAKLCKKEGVDVIFYPSFSKMYPKDYQTFVYTQDLSNAFCGKFRPGHFKGVTTIVVKLFNIIAPDRAYFGQKDAQQAIIIKKMSQDLNIPVKIQILPTVRERDGLAMSSRNIHLSAKERKEAAVIYKALKLAKCLLDNGNRNTAHIIAKLRELINKHRSLKVEYVSIVEPKTLKEQKMVKPPALIALAVYAGKIRLIDNIIIRDGS